MPAAVSSAAVVAPLSASLSLSLFSAVLALLLLCRGRLGPHLLLVRPDVARPASVPHHHLLHLLVALVAVLGPIPRPIDSLSRGSRPRESLSSGTSRPRRPLLPVSSPRSRTVAGARLAAPPSCTVLHPIIWVPVAEGRLLHGSGDIALLRASAVSSGVS